MEPCVTAPTEGAHSALTHERMRPGDSQFFPGQAKPSVEKQPNLGLSQEFAKWTLCGQGLSPATALGTRGGVGHAAGAHATGLEPGRVEPGLAGAAVVFLTRPLHIGSRWPFVHFDKVQGLLKPPQSDSRISKNSQKVWPALEISATAITTRLHPARASLLVAVMDTLVDTGLVQRIAVAQGGSWSLMLRA